MQGSQTLANFPDSCDAIEIAGWATPYIEGLSKTDLDAHARESFFPVDAVNSDLGESSFRRLITGVAMRNRWTAPIMRGCELS
jgi:hypothetical protein